MPDRDLETLYNMVQSARKVVAFTGAGISTECGIPDFRTPGGIWDRFKPIDFQSFVASAQARREGLTRYLKIRESVGEVQPGRGHRALAKLAGTGKLSHVITQNIDGLHQASGLNRDQVIELHGNGTYAHCLDCHQRYELDWVADWFDNHDNGAPDCNGCGGMIKTATISFGQEMPQAEMRRAEAATFDCDLFLAIGSSLVVYPAAGFPIIAKRNGAQLVIINREATELDMLADLVIHGEIGEVFAGFLEPDH